MRFPLKPVVAAIALAFAAPAFAQFQPSGQTTITGTVIQPQTLSNATGTISPTGAISIASGGGVPLTMTGTSTLLNDGRIQTLGTGRAIDSNSAGANLTVTNNGLVSSVSADAFAVRQGSASVSLTNSGTIQVMNGGQAIDWASISTGSNVLMNTGTITSFAEDAVRPGQNGTVTNSGFIMATPVPDASDPGNPTGSDGIDLRTQRIVTVTNTGTIAGRHGIATDGDNNRNTSLTVHNNAGGMIQALNGSGLNVDVNTALPMANPLTVAASVTNALGATIKGGLMADPAITTGDGDGIDVDGILTLNNSGQVLGLGAKGAGNNAEGIAAGGGTITNAASGRIIGSTLAADAPNGDTARAGNGILIDNSSGGDAFAKTIVENSGLIEGKTGFAIKLVGTFDDEVTNFAGGTIQGAVHGGGVGTGAALQTGGGADKVINRGAIVGGNGSALDLQDGDDKLTIEGGAASIAGSVSGGSGADTVVFDLGLGNTFSHSNSISSFETVEAKSGLATIAGANRIDSTSTLLLSGGAFGIATAGGADGQTFASLVLTGDSGIDLNRSTSLTFNGLGAVTGGKTLSIVDYDYADSPDYAIRFLGNLTTDPDFLALINGTSIDGNRAAFEFDDTYTNITVPEPSTLAVMGLGMVLLGFRSRRRKPKDEG